MRMKKFTSYLLISAISISNIAVIAGLIAEKTRLFTIIFIIFAMAITLWEIKKAPLSR